MNLKLSIAALTMALATLSGVAQIKWLETSHNFGTFDEDMGKVSCEIRFVNVGDTDVVIETVRPTCGCTATDYPRRPIAPGDTARIHLTYNPIGRPGKFDKDVIVMTNTQPKRVKLVISGNVIGSANTIRSKYPEAVGNLKFNTLVAPFGKIAMGNEGTAVIRAYNQSRDSMEVSFEKVPPYVTIHCIPSKVGPSGITTLTIFYNTTKKNDWGTVSDTFDVVTHDKDSNATNRAKVDVIAIITENEQRLAKVDVKEAPKAVLSTDKLDFTIMDKNSTTTHEQTFTIENYGNNPLKVRKIYSVDPAISISHNSATIKKGKSMKVKVKVNPSKIDGDMLNAKIMIITNDPANALTSIRAVGEAK